jgi:hypothetical protein
VVAGSGTAGALAGGLVEYRHVPSTGDGLRFTVGGFSGAEPEVYDTGYVPGVRKSGGYVTLQRGFMQRHVVGYAQIKQSGMLERNLLTFTNYIPGGSGFFLYQAAEVDLKGPADGTASSGLSYFLMNARVSAGPRVELNGTYNRGRSIDARRLTEDVLNNRPLTQQAIEGLQCESAGGRILRVARQTDVWASYYQDRNNRDDEPTGRLTVGGHAGNVAGTGLDISANMARYDRPTGAYNSTYFSVRHALGRSVYVSGDYSTSLSVIRFVRSDGVIIETRPSTKRYAGTANATLSRHFSLMLVADYARRGLRQATAALGSHVSDAMKGTSMTRCLFLAISVAIPRWRRHRRLPRLAAERARRRWCARRACRCRTARSLWIAHHPHRQGDFTGTFQASTWTSRYPARARNARRPAPTAALLRAPAIGASVTASATRERRAPAVRAVHDAGGRGDPPAVRGWRHVRGHRHRGGRAGHPADWRRGGDRSTSRPDHRSSGQCAGREFRARCNNPHRRRRHLPHRHGCPHRPGLRSCWMEAVDEAVSVGVLR